MTRRQHLKQVALLKKSSGARFRNPSVATAGDHRDSVNLRLASDLSSHCLGREHCLGDLLKRHRGPCDSINELPRYILPVVRYSLKLLAKLTPARDTALEAELFGVLSAFASLVIWPGFNWKKE